MEPEFSFKYKAFKAVFLSLMALFFLSPDSSSGDPLSRRVDGEILPINLDEKTPIVGRVSGTFKVIIPAAGILHVEMGSDDAYGLERVVEDPVSVNVHRLDHALLIEFARRGIYRFRITSEKNEASLEPFILWVQFTQQTEKPWDDTTRTVDEIEADPDPPDPQPEPLCPCHPDCDHPTPICTSAVFM